MSSYDFFAKKICFIYIKDVYLQRKIGVFRLGCRS